MDDFTLTAVRDLQIGDMVDLEGDAFADPRRDSVSAEFELQIVARVDPETDTCFCVWFESYNPVGFPPDHKLKVCGHDAEYSNAQA